MLLIYLNILNMFDLLIFKLLYFFCTDTTNLVYDKVAWKMGKPKKSVILEFFEERADDKGFISSCNLCTFEV